ncbi:MAG: pyridoxal phosphate-dependent aminotransferase [Phycisphaerae bacterium]|nr:pyridoxal phosphate-dependent aminotransferase [Phycisphaerae bacterium]
MKLSARTLNLEESATLAVSAKASRMKAEGIDVITFGAGEPEFHTPDHIKQAAIAALLEGATGYSKPASGLKFAKEAVCTKLARDAGLNYTPEQVIITPGGKMAVFQAIHAVIDPGDEVVIPVPYWVSYPEMVRLAGGVPVFVTGRRENDYKLTPDELAAVLTPRTRMVIMNSPCNPSGVTYNPDETRALANVLAERDLLVLSDEIYDQLLYHGQQALSFAAVSEPAFARTITVNAPSKTYAMTGWRLGYAAGPAEIIKAMDKLQSQTTSGACTFNQYALAEALAGDQTVVEEMRREFEARGNYMYPRLASMRGVWCPKPTGAFFCFPNVGATYANLGVSGSVEFADLLLERARVAVVPGLAFGMDDHIRLSFGATLAHIDEGLNRLEQFLAS